MFKQKWCFKLSPSDAIARACQVYQREDGYIRKYIVKFEELKRFFGEMSMSTLIDMFMRNTRRAVHNRYNELKRRKLTWEQFLSEVTVIDDEESRWDTSRSKDEREGKRRSTQDTHKNSNKKRNNGLSARAEDFRKELKVSKEEYQKRVREKLCLRCGKKGNFVKECKVNISGKLGKDRKV